MSCQPIINGILWSLGQSIFDCDCHSMSVEQWRREFNDMKRLGMEKMLLFNGLSQSAERSYVASPDIVGFIADNCAENGMELFLTIGDNPQWDMRKTLKESLGRFRGILNRLRERHEGHPALKGWYIPYEFCIPFEDEGPVFKEFYKGAVEMCKEATPQLPVLISPFFNPPTNPELMGYGNHPASEYYDFWSDLISACHFDILSLQDTGGQHFSFFDVDITEPYIAAYARACKENNCRFWGNVETGEFHIESAAAFAEKCGVHSHVNDANLKEYWRPVPIERLKTKLNVISKYSELNLSWGYQPFYRPSLGGRCEKAYMDYAKYIEKKEWKA